MALLPHPPDILFGEASDKLQHMLAFAVLTALALPAFPRAGQLRIFLLLAAFGALIELLQEIPDLHRDSSFYDWLADCGAVLTILLIGAMLRALLRSKGGGGHLPDPRGCDMEESGP